MLIKQSSTEQQHISNTMKPKSLSDEQSSHNTKHSISHSHNNY